MRDGYDDDDRQPALALERPYKRDDGQPIAVLADILPGGEHIYEPYAMDMFPCCFLLTSSSVQSSAETLSENLLRIFRERGKDFFQKRPSERTLQNNTDQAADADDDVKDDDVKDDDSDADQDEAGTMTTEELSKMRAEILPKLQFVFF
jgi:mediator of RNA polymerase II transcription subunit 17, fungi type